MTNNLYNYNNNAQPQSDLWQRLCEGDDEALAELYKKEYHHMYNYGRKVIDDDEVVEDAIQDVFATIWRTRNKLKPAKSVTSYLVVSLRRRLLRLKKKERKEIKIGYQQTESYPDIKFTVLDILITSEDDVDRKKIVVEAINMLPAQKREVIYLQFINGMDYEEIALIMGLGVHTVRNYTSEALMRLKKIILANVPHANVLYSLHS